MSDEIEGASAPEAPKKKRPGLANQAILDKMAKVLADFEARRGFGRVELVIQGGQARVASVTRTYKGDPTEELI